MLDPLRRSFRLARWAAHYYGPNHDVTIQTSSGLLTVNSKDWLIGKHLFVKRSYEVELMIDSIDFLFADGYLKERSNGTVVDVGANVGMNSTFLLLEEYFSNAIAFEPGEENFRLLEHNARQNGLSGKMNCFQVALSSSEGQLTLELAEDNSGDNRIRNSTAPGEVGEHLRRTTSVSAKTFDTFLSDENVDPATIDLIWMDIQGHEGHFFRGAEKFFAARKVPVVSEFWPYGILRAGMSEKEYCDIVSNAFTQVFEYADRGYRAVDISNIATMFETYRSRRSAANLIFV